MFSCEYCKILKNTYLEKYLHTAVFGKFLQKCLLFTEFRHTIESFHVRWWKLAKHTLKIYGVHTARF